MMAEQLEAGVVVMGAVSRNRWKRLFFGATADWGMGVLIEVPVMLMLVRICLRTRSWFPES